MKTLTFLLILTGCNSLDVYPTKIKPAFIPKSVRMESCVHRLLKSDVKPETSINVCERIHYTK